MEKAVGIRNYRERMQAVQKLNLTSDLLSSVVFEDVLAVQDVLRILTGIRGLKVVRVEPQRSYRNLYGHSSVLDVWAEDEKQNQYNLEIQIAEDEDHLRRSRFIQGRVDSRSLPGGTEYGKLPELYLIFITEKDFLKTGTGITEVVRVIKGTDREVDNGVHEIYANLECPTVDEEKTRLLRYIKKTNGKVVSCKGFENLAKRVEHLKNEEGDVKGMCELLEKEWKDGNAVGWEAGMQAGRRAGMQAGRREGMQEGDMLRLISLALKKQEKGFPVDEIAEMLEEDERQIDRILLAAAEAGSNEPEKVYRCL